jgi:hypothetical protein
MNDSETFAKIFETLRQRYLLLNRNDPVEVRKLTEENEILPLVIEMSGFFFVRKDGTIAALSFDDLDNPKPVDSQRICNTVWFMASQTYPELEPFTPIRGEDGIDCPYCNGTGTVPNIPPEISDRIVCYCGGLGWIPIED